MDKKKNQWHNLKNRWHTQARGIAYSLEDLKDENILYVRHLKPEELRSDHKPQPLEKFEAKIISDLHKASEEFENGIVSKEVFNALLSSVPKLTRQPIKPKIIRPPGSRLNSFAEFVFSKKNYETIYRDIISDMRAEYCEALKAKRLWKSRMVLISWHYHFLVTMLAHLVKGVRDLFKLLPASSQK